MAYSNSTSDRMDELRFRSQQSPRNDANLLGLVSPQRNGTRQPLQQDGRNGLMRRFTADSARVPTIGSLNSQRAGQDSSEYGLPSVNIVHHFYCLSTLPVPSTLSSYCPICNNTTWLLLTCTFPDVSQSPACKQPLLLSNLPVLEHRDLDQDHHFGASFLFFRTLNLPKSSGSL
jgi:hypothetical protein